MSSEAVTLEPCTFPQAQPPRHPFPRYPTGWFQVAYSDEIKPGQVKPLVYFGKQLVTFRTESGKLSVLDAVCPHMRAHIGLGGKVKGESVVCPSHGWQFGADGVCTGVPYLQKIPPGSSLACWPLREKNGLVMVWHDVDKKPPSWEVPHIPEFSSDEWITPIRREWKIRSSNHEAAENLVDRAHVSCLQNMPESFIKFDGHKIHIKIPTTMSTSASKVEGQVESLTVGLGFAINRFTGPCEIMLIGCVAPVDKEYVRLRCSFTFRKTGDADIVSDMAEAFVDEVARQLEQDKPVCEHKEHVKQPLVGEVDGPTGKFRHWVGQFYPDWYKEEARAAHDLARGT